MPSAGDEPRGTARRPKLLLEPYDFVFHEHIGESAREEIGQEAVEIVGIAPFSLSLGEQDAAHGGVAGAGSPEAGSNRAEQPPRFRVAQPEGVQNPQGYEKFTLHRRMESHSPSMGEGTLCV
jgi:hypothetical protein